MDVNTMTDMQGGGGPGTGIFFLLVNRGFWMHFFFAVRQEILLKMPLWYIVGTGKVAESAPKWSIELQMLLATSKASLGCGKWQYGHRIGIYGWNSFFIVFISNRGGISSLNKILRPSPSCFQAGFI